MRSLALWCALLLLWLGACARPAPPLPPAPDPLAPLAEFLPHTPPTTRLALFLDMDALRAAPLWGSLGPLVLNAAPHSPIYRAFVSALRWDPLQALRRGYLTWREHPAPTAFTLAASFANLPPGVVEEFAANPPPSQEIGGVTCYQVSTSLWMGLPAPGRVLLGPQDALEGASQDEGVLTGQATLRERLEATSPRAFWRLAMLPTDGQRARLSSWVGVSFTKVTGISVSLQATEKLEIAVRLSLPWLGAAGNFAEAASRRRAAWLAEQTTRDAEIAASMYLTHQEGEVFFTARLDARQAAALFGDLVLVVGF